MRFIVFITLLTQLAGCYSAMDKAQSEYQCKDRGGVYLYGNALLNIQCNNGEMIDYSQKTALPQGWRVGENEDK